MASSSADMGSGIGFGSCTHTTVDYLSNGSGLQCEDCNQVLPPEEVFRR